jgi:hypothetical protein
MKKRLILKLKGLKLPDIGTKFTLNNRSIVYKVSSIQHLERKIRVDNNTKFIGFDEFFENLSDGSLQIVKS